MAKYRKVDPRIWDDEKFKSMSHDGQLLFFCFLTHPHMTSIGAMRATIPGLAAEIGWDLKAFQESFRESLSKRMIEQDETAPLIALPNFLKYNKPENPNVLKAWGGAFSHLPDCHLKSLLYDRLRSFAESLGKSYQKAFGESFPIPCRHDIRKPEQEQEQEQEPEKEKEPEPESTPEPLPPTGQTADALGSMDGPAFNGIDRPALLNALVQEEVPADRWKEILFGIEKSLGRRKPPPPGKKDSPTGYALKIIQNKAADIRAAAAEDKAARRNANVKTVNGSMFDADERKELVEKYAKLFPGVKVVFDDTQPFEPDIPRPGPDPGPGADDGTTPAKPDKTEKEDANAT